MLNEGANIFDALPATEEKEPEPSDSSPETEKPAGQGESIEEAPKDLNDKTALHKDARFKRVIEERNRERAEKRELLERLEKLEKGNQPTQTKTPTTKPAWFAKYFGDDEEAWQGFQQMTASAKEEAKAEAIADIKREQESERNSSSKWDKWVNEQVESLEEQGETFERNALLKVMDQYRPTDDEGNLDFHKGLELLRLKGDKPSQVEAKRKAAAMTATPMKGSEPSKRNVVSRADILKWRQTGEL